MAGSHLASSVSLYESYRICLFSLSLRCSADQPHANIYDVQARYTLMRIDMDICISYFFTPVVMQSLLLLYPIPSHRVATKLVIFSFLLILFFSLSCVIVVVVFVAAVSLVIAY